MNQSKKSMQINQNEKKVSWSAIYVASSSQIMQNEKKNLRFWNKVYSLYARVEMAFLLSSLSKKIQTTRKHLLDNNENGFYNTLRLDLPIHCF